MTLWIMGSPFSNFISLVVWQWLSAQKHGYEKEQVYEKACQNSVYFCSLSPECSGKLMEGTGSSDFEKEGICCEKCGNLWRWFPLWKSTFDMICDLSTYIVLDHSNSCCIVLLTAVQQGRITFKRILSLKDAGTFLFFCLKSFLGIWCTLFSCILICWVKPSCSQSVGKF